MVHPEREKKVDIQAFDIEPKPFSDNLQKIYEYKKEGKLPLPRPIAVMAWNFRSTN